MWADAEVPGETTPLVRDKLKLASFPFSLTHYSSELEREFGRKLLVTIFASQFCVKGFIYAFLASATQFLLATYGVQGPRLQILLGVVNLPFALKPIIGLMSDAFPIRGYHKGPYMALTTVLGVVSLALIGMLPQDEMSLEQVTCCLFMASLQAATCDLLVEAKYSEQIRAKPTHGPDLISYVWGGIFGAGLVAVCLVGLVLRNWGPKACFLFAVPPSTLVLFPVAWNYLEESFQPAAAVATTRRHLAEESEACFLCLLTFAATTVMVFVGITYESARINAVTSISCALVLLVAFSVLIHPMIAKVNAFFLIQSCLCLSISGATFFFYTDSPDEYARGPHFSVQFFTTGIGLVGSVTSLMGIWFYNKYMHDWNYRSLIWFTNLSFSVLCLLDVVMLKRLNLQLGIPDHAMVLGASGLQCMVWMWMLMPGVIMLSHLCPKGMEAIMFALLAGCQNLGATVASACGAVMLEWLDCQPSGRLREDAQFDKLWLGSAISSVLPLLSLLLAPWLIPDAKQTDALLPDGAQGTAASGSLWRKCRASAPHA